MQTGAPAQAPRQGRPDGAVPAGGVADGHDLSDEQRQALVALESAHRPRLLLFGATGSGKTEVYLQATQRVLARTPTPRCW